MQYIGDLLVSSCLGHRVDPSGKQICQLCPKRVTNFKGKKYNYGQGYVCQDCYDQTRSGKPKNTLAVPPAASSSPSTAPPPIRIKRKRTQSDPGQNKIITSYSPRSMRVRAPKPIMADKKKLKLEEEKSIAHALDVTHKKRMAALKKAAAASKDAFK